jgi:hypothetical protein
MLLTLLQRDRAEDLQAARLFDRERGQLRLLPVRAVVRRGLQVHCVPFRPPVGPTHSTIIAEGVHSAPTHIRVESAFPQCAIERHATVADALCRVMLPVRAGTTFSGPGGMPHATLLQKTEAPVLQLPHICSILSPVEQGRLQSAPVRRHVH